MVLDHVNAYLLGASHPALFALGRLAFPLFTVVLAYHLAAADTAALRRVLARLGVFGLAAQPFTMLLRAPLMESRLGEDPVWWQGNVLFTFAVGVEAALLRGTRRLRNADSTPSMRHGGRA